MNFIFNETKDYQIFELLEDLTVRNLSPLKNHFLKIIERPNQIVGLNLQKMSFMDSSGLGLIVNFARKLKDRNGFIFLFNFNNQVEKLLEVTHAGVLVNIIKNQEELNQLLNRLGKQKILSENPENVKLNPGVVVLYEASLPLRNLFKVQLEKLNLEVMGTKHEDIVFELVAKNHPALIIIDGDLANVSIVSLVEEIRKIYADIQYLLTGNVGLQKDWEGKIDFRFLEKPVNTKILLETVKEILKIRRE